MTAAVRILRRRAYRVIDALWPEPATAPSIRHPAYQALGYARWCDTHPTEG